LARSADLSHSTVDNLVTGRRKYCSPETVRALENALRAEPASLFMELSGNGAELGVKDQAASAEQKFTASD
jgi:hypothetical protein